MDCGSTDVTDYSYKLLQIQQLQRMQQFPVTGYTSHGRRAVVGEYITHSQDRLTPACMQRPDLAYGTVTLYGELTHTVR